MMSVILNPDTLVCAHDGNDKALSLKIMFKADSLPVEFGQLDEYDGKWFENTSQDDDEAVI